MVGRNQEAVMACKKALEIDRNYAVAYNNLALAYYYEKRYDLAINYCDKAIELGYKVVPKLLELLKPYRK